MSPSPIKIHVSPKGDWKGSGFSAHAWTSGENRAKKWTYWWISIDAEGLTKAEYDVSRGSAVVVQRTRLSESPRLFAKTGFVDEEPDDDGDSPIGGAAKLDKGVYAVNFYLTISGKAHLLRGVRFRVADCKAAKGGWQIKTPLPDESKG